MSAPEFPLAFRIAWRSDPAPPSLRFVTVKVDKQGAVLADVEARPKPQGCTPASALRGRRVTAVRVESHRCRLPGEVAVGPMGTTSPLDRGDRETSPSEVSRKRRETLPVAPLFPDFRAGSRRRGRGPRR